MSPLKIGHCGIPSRRKFSGKEDHGQYKCMLVSRGIESLDPLSHPSLPRQFILLVHTLPILPREAIQTKQEYCLTPQGGLNLGKLLCALLVCLLAFHSHHQEKSEALGRRVVGEIFVTPLCSNLKGFAEPEIRQK